MSVTIKVDTSMDDCYPFTLVAGKSGVDGIRFSPPPDVARKIGIRQGAVVLMYLCTDDVDLPVCVIATKSGSGGFRLTPPLPICRFLNISHGDLVQVNMKVIGYVKNGDGERVVLIDGNAKRG